MVESVVTGCLAIWFSIILFQIDSSASYLVEIIRQQNGRECTGLRRGLLRRGVSDGPSRLSKAPAHKEVGDNDDDDDHDLHQMFL